MDFIGNSREGLLRAKSHYIRGIEKVKEGEGYLDQRNELEPRREELRKSASEVAGAVLKSLADVQHGLAKLSELFAESKNTSGEMMRNAENAETSFQGAELLTTYAEELISTAVGSKEKYTKPINSSDFSKTAACSAAIIDDSAHTFFSSSSQKNQEMQNGISAIAQELSGIVSEMPSFGMRDDRHQINLARFNSSQTDVAADITCAINSLNQQIENT